MDEFARAEGPAASLARLRMNAVLAMDTSSGRAISHADLQRLDAIVAAVFGERMKGLRPETLGTAPAPDGPIFRALSERLPKDQAEDAGRFIIDLHGRVHNWFNQ